jgi:hypothetical protein
MTEDTKSFKLTGYQLYSLTLGIKLDYVIPVVGPTDYVTIFNILGYGINSLVNNPDQIQAQKQNTTIFVDNGRRVLAISSIDIDQAYASLSEILQLIKNIFNIELTNFVTFYETDITGYYYLDNEDAYQIMTKLYANTHFLKDFSNIIGMEVQQSTIKLTPFGKNINDPQWYELFIEPKLNSTGNAFVSHMICRDTDIVKVINNGRNVGEQVKKIIEKILH